MSKIEIKTSKEIFPKVYAYSTPEVPKHNGWVKIGYTERENVRTRIEEQTHTVGLKANIEWSEDAIFKFGEKKSFKDTDFHVYLRKKGYENQDRTEWFRVDGETSHNEFNYFRENGCIVPFGEEVLPYNLREEQEKAVRQTKIYFENNENGEFLWNAKPRFGKTLSVYDFFKQIKAKRVLIVTNRPAIANSWYEDYVKFMGDESGFKFVSDTEALKKEKFVISRKQYSNMDILSNYGCIEFVSLQDLKGSIYFGGKYNKLEEVADCQWDVLVVDEAHEGVDTYKTDVAFDRIHRKFTLHLSGTPFKALANEKFNENAIFNWTYADEQRAKANWDNRQEQENPYVYLPRLNLYTYQMSEIVKDIVEKGIKIGDEVKEYAFDLNEFFSTKTDNQGNISFIYEESVDKFLDSLTTLEKMPFSTPELREDLSHTFWLLNRVDSAKALHTKLKKHPIFKNYEIVLAAGDGKIDDNDETEKSYNRVKKAIKENDKTITISVGQLTTGVTIPEWTGVLMLSNVKSPSLYMQAAFRAQNPCLYMDKKGDFYRKENAYVFDFDPARTLIIFEEFANDLYSSTSSGHGTSEDRKQRVYELLNFFPVIGEDDNGEMTELDAEKVLSIPRKIKSKEVVKRGFMSNFLFANISNIFHNAPQEVFDIIEELKAVEEPKNKIEKREETVEKLKKDVEEVQEYLSDKDEVQITDTYVIGKSAECFGNKIYKPIVEETKVAVSDIQAEDLPNKKEEAKKIKEVVKTQILEPAMIQLKEYYGSDLKTKDANNISKKITENFEKKIDKAYTNYEIETNRLEINKKKELEECKVIPDKEEREKKALEVEKKFEVKQKKVDNELKEVVKKTNEETFELVKTDTIKAVEITKKENDKKIVEDDIKNHLRGFSRTIPSFLMAYGDENTTLANFDKIVPENVFKEVVGITLQDFRLLRDGKWYDDEKTGELKEFKGCFFDEVVFNDSVKEFMARKDKLSRYFEEDLAEDIFDYIPPQKTNQIYTPKNVVKEMVDLLEENNPGCFEDDTKTFADLYMKSGLYITEIVKRLYRNPVMKSKYPNDIERLKHIFKYQVYGLAPTEIIYRIALNFILGFDKNSDIKDYNLKCVDTVPLSKEGILEQELDKIFGGCE